MFPPCSLGGTTLTIRKFQTRFFTADELVRIGTMTPDVLAIGRRPRSRRNENILISGGTSTGQDDAPECARGVLAAATIGSCSSRTRRSSRLDRPNLVRFEARREQADLPAVTIRELLRATLRHRPDRIIVGEVRGGEAFDLLQALNTGHSGSLSTIHANSAEQALARFASCVVQSGVELPYQAVRYQIADAIDLVLHLGRHRGARVVEELIQVERYDVERDGYDHAVLFQASRAAADTIRDPDRRDVGVERWRTAISIQRLRAARASVTERHLAEAPQSPDRGFDGRAVEPRAPTCAARDPTYAIALAVPAFEKEKTDDRTVDQVEHCGDDRTPESPLLWLRHLGAEPARRAVDGDAVRGDAGRRGGVRGQRHRAGRRTGRDVRTTRARRRAPSSRGSARDTRRRDISWRQLTTDSSARTHLSVGCGNGFASRRRMTCTSRPRVDTQQLTLGAHGGVRETSGR